MKRILLALFLMCSSAFSEIFGHFYSEFNGLVNPSSVTLNDGNAFVFISNSARQGHAAFIITTPYSTTSITNIYNMSYSYMSSLYDGSRTITGPCTITLDPSYEYMYSSGGNNSSVFDESQLSTMVNYKIIGNTSNTEITTIIKTNTVINTITNAIGYTLSEVADMRVGSQMVSLVDVIETPFNPDNGLQEPTATNRKARFHFELDVSDALTTSWQTNVHTIEVDMPVTNDVQFFRLRMD